MFQKTCHRLQGSSAISRRQSRVGNLASAISRKTGCRHSGQVKPVFRAADGFLRLCRPSSRPQKSDSRADDSTFHAQKSSHCAQTLFSRAGGSGSRAEKSSLRAGKSSFHTEKSFYRAQKPFLRAEKSFSFAGISLQPIETEAKTLKVKSLMPKSRNFPRCKTLTP
jgi:hypothetical protein